MPNILSLQFLYRFCVSPSAASFSCLNLYLSCTLFASMHSAPCTNRTLLVHNAGPYTVYHIWTLPFEHSACQPAENRHAHAAQSNSGLDCLARSCMHLSTSAMSWCYRCLCTLMLNSARHLSISKSALLQLGLSQLQSVSAARFSGFRLIKPSHCHLCVLLQGVKMHRSVQNDLCNIVA